jgi:hypothetical protein
VDDFDAGGLGGGSEGFVFGVGVEDDATELSSRWLSFLRGNHFPPNFAVAKISFIPASLFNGDSRVTS